MNTNMPEKTYLGFCYVPVQKFENLYEVDDALANGTIFTDLNIPFDAYKNETVMNPFK